MIYFNQKDKINDTICRGKWERYDSREIIISKKYFGGERMMGMTADSDYGIETGIKFVSGEILNILG